MRDLPGKPDIVFSRARVVVFCDGDFWHWSPATRAPRQACARRERAVLDGEDRGERGSGSPYHATVTRRGMDGGATVGNRCSPRCAPSGATRGGGSELEVFCQTGCSFARRMNAPIGLRIHRLTVLVNTKPFVPNYE
ncbi:MAG: very short patch repair endonuclease [Acidobacteriota bacterium]|nr:very short patch repair endonuclease [Acidobacteriota bacterium]